MSNTPETIVGPGGERMTVETLTAGDARQLLEANTENYRRIRGSMVDRYVRDMVAGNWHFTFDPIRVSSTGLLVDGQHRLLAQVESETTQTWAIVRGLSAEAGMVIDTGGARVSADHLRHIGVGAPTQVAGIARLAIGSQRNRARTAVSTPEIDDWVRENPNVVKIAMTLSSWQLRKLVPVSPIGYCWWRFAAIDPYKAEEFFTRLNSLENLDRDSPILALHKRFQSLRHQHGSLGGASVRFEVIATVIYAWNAWIRDEPRTLLRTVSRADGRMHMPEPVGPRKLDDTPAPAEVEADQLPASRRRHAG
jgi:hypothetical protein